MEERALLLNNITVQGENNLQYALRQNFQNLASRSDKKSIALKIGNVSFILLMSSLVTPYYLIAGVDVDTPNKEVNLLSPECIVFTNVVQAAYAADEVWNFFLSDEATSQSQWKKRLKQGSAFMASIWQVLPYSIGAYFISHSSIEKGILIPSITLSGLCFYYFSSYLFLNSGLYPTVNYAQHALQKNNAWHATHELKMSFMNLLNDAGLDIQYEVGKSGKRYLKMISMDKGEDELLWLLKKGQKWQQAQNIDSPIGSFFFNSAKYMCSAIMATFTGASQVGYFCATSSFFQPYTKIASWGVSSAIMTPVTFFASFLGFKSLGMVFDNLRALANGKKTNLPFSLRNYPKTTCALALLMLFVSAFGWADDEETLQTCPDNIKEIFNDIIYYCAGSFNALVTFQFIDNLVKKGASLGGNDAGIATKLINVMENILNIIDNSTDEQFAAMLVSKKAKPLQTFFQTHQPILFESFVNEYERNSGYMRN